MTKYTVYVTWDNVPDEIKAKYPNAPTDWAEYTVFLCAGGMVCRKWESLTETFNGAQFLTRADAPNIEKDVRAHPEDYFPEMAQ